MTWDTLNKATEAYLEKERLKKIAEIVAKHPEWQQSEPVLIDLLKQVKAA